LRIADCGLIEDLRLPDCGSIEDLTTNPHLPINRKSDDKSAFAHSADQFENLR